MSLHLYKHILIVIVLIYTSGSAQYLPGGRQVALSHSDVAANNDIFAAFNNPSGLAYLNYPQMGIYYSPAPFGLNQLANAYGAIGNNFSFGTAAVGFSIYGFELYKETKLIFSYGNEFLENFSAGITISSNNISIKNYNKDNSLSVNVGFTTQITDNILLGFAAHNISRSSYGKEDNQIPSLFLLGASFNISDNFSLHTGFEKEIEKTLSFRLGIEYSPVDIIQLMVGLMNEPNLFSGGICFNYEWIRIDYALYKHQDLGLTHQFSLIISMKDI